MANPALQQRDWHYFKVERSAWKSGQNLCRIHEDCVQNSFFSAQSS